MSRRPPPDARPEKGVAPGARRCRCRGRPAAPRRGFRRRRRRSRRRRAEGPATRHEGRGVGPQGGEGRPHRRPGTRVLQASVRWQQQARVRPPTARGRRVEARGGRTRLSARARGQQRARRRRAVLAQGRREVTRRGRPRRERECRWTPGAPAADPATRRVEPVTGHRTGMVHGGREVGGVRPSLSLICLSSVHMKQLPLHHRPLCPHLPLAPCPLAFTPVSSFSIWPVFSLSAHAASPVPTHLPLPRSPSLAPPQSTHHPPLPSPHPSLALPPSTPPPTPPPRLSPRPASLSCPLHPYSPPFPPFRVFVVRVCVIIECVRARVVCVCVVLSA